MLGEQEVGCAPLPLLYTTLDASPVVSAVDGPESSESMAVGIMNATAFFHGPETPVDPDSFHGC